MKNVDPYKTKIASYTMGNGTLNQPGRGVDLPLPSDKVKERVELYLYPPLAFVACSRVNFTFTFTFTFTEQKCFDIHIKALPMRKTT